MNEKKKMININEKSTKNIKIKKIIEEKVSKKKMNSNTIMFENVNVKNPNTRTFIIFYIDNMTSFADTFTSKFLFKFKNFSKIINNALTKA